jgi:hypothetical protein
VCSPHPRSRTPCLKVVTVVTTVTLVPVIAAFCKGGAAISPESKEDAMSREYREPKGEKRDSDPKPITAFRARHGAAEGLEGRRVHPQAARCPRVLQRTSCPRTPSSLGTEATRTSISLAVLVLPTARRGPRTRRSARSNRPRARPAPARLTGGLWPLVGVPEIGQHE